MIAKKYRLSEREIRKVFAQKKPFFSYAFIANVRKNSLSHARIAILLSSKVTTGSVNRNFFRRLFYENSREILNFWYDIVIIPKKGTKLFYKNLQDCRDFSKNLSFIYQKIFSDFPYEHDKTP